jgi:O-antigen/teichoic acid export membrane protein
VVLLLLAPTVGAIFNFWTHGNLELNYALFAALGVGVACRGLGAPLQNFQYSTNQLAAQSWCAGARTVLSLAGAAVLLPQFGLLGAGCAVVLGELVGSLALPVWFVTREFRRRGARFPWAQFGRGAVMVGATGVVLLVSEQAVSMRWPAMGAGFAVVASLAWAQWRSLDGELRERFRTTLKLVSRR